MKIERDEMRACAEYADRLVDLSDGELPDDERQLVELHAAKCVGCRSELARLDASLAALRRTGFQPVQSVGQHFGTDRDGPEGPSYGNGTRSVPTTYYAAAALSLALLLAATFGAIRFFGPGRLPETAQAAPQRTEAVPSANRPHPVVSRKTAPLDEATILHQIALLEQQARLQASLDLMPNDPWFAEHRAANEELLAQFKSAVAAGSAEVNTDDESPLTDGSLDEGETL